MPELEYILNDQKAILELQLQELLTTMPNSAYMEAYVDQHGHVTDIVSDIILAKEKLELQIQAIDEMLSELSDSYNETK